MRLAVISHAASLPALGEAGNCDLCWETVAFYSILGNSCEMTALKRLQGAGIRLHDWCLYAFCPLPSLMSWGGWRATLGGFQRKERWYPCWWRTYPCWLEDLGRTNEHTFPGNYGWWLGFLVSSNGGVCIAVSFGGKGSLLQQFARFY